MISRSWCLWATLTRRSCVSTILSTVHLSYNHYTHLSLNHYSPLSSSHNASVIATQKPFKMFGYVCGGRPVETAVNQVEPTKYVFTVPDAAKINFIALFLLPGAALPADMAAAVYAQLPGKTEFTLLGALSAAKNSAIFKLNMGAATSDTNDVDDMMDDDAGASPAEGSATQTITFGISIEPASQVEALIAAQRMPSRQPKAIAAPAPPMSVDSVAALANKIVGHAYNFLASFVDAQGNVPIKAFDDWWAKFKSRLSADPDFLKSIDST